MIYRGRTLPARRVERSKMLLLGATGHSAEEIAERLDGDPADGVPVAEPIRSTGYEGGGTGCVAFRASTRYPACQDHRDRRENHAPNARGRHSLEHAHAGARGRRQPVHGGTHLAGTRFEAAPGE